MSSQKKPNAGIQRRQRRHVVHKCFIPSCVNVKCAETECVYSSNWRSRMARMAAYRRRGALAHVTIQYNAIPLTRNVLSKCNKVLSSLCFMKIKMAASCYPPNREPFSSISTCAPGFFVHKTKFACMHITKEGITRQWVLFSTMFTLLLRMKNKNGVCVK